MVSKINESLVHRFFDEVLNEGKLAIAAELVASDSVDHGVSILGASSGGEGIKRAIGAIRMAMPDLHFTVEDLLEREDKVVARWTMSGTLTDELAGIKPTGKQVSVTGVAIYRVAQGKIVESWGNWDALGMLMQLGVIPETAVPMSGLR